LWINKAAIKQSSQRLLLRVQAIKKPCHEASLELCSANVMSYSLGGRSFHTLALMSGNCEDRNAKHSLRDTVMSAVVRHEHQSWCQKNWSLWAGPPEVKTA